MQELEGKVAVVTGAASGLGRAFVERLVREGMQVVLADIEVPALEQAVDELRNAGHDVTGVVTDVSSRASVEALAERTIETYGGVHLVCNNTGVEGYMDGPVWQATPNDWAWLMGVNFWGVVHGVEAFLPHMLATGEPGHIVNTGSDAGFTSASILYSVTKHSVVAYTELVFNHLRELSSPVKISLLAPSATATRIALGSRNRPASLANTPDPMRKRIGERARRTMHEINSAAATPAMVAERLLGGIRADDFYIFVDGRSDEWIKARTDAVIARRHPPKPRRRIILTDEN